MRYERLLERLVPSTLPYDMFDGEHTEREAQRARKLESIYHLGQERIWDGREVLRDLLAKHGTDNLEPQHRKALGRIFSIIMWGELAAWKISAQLADELVPLEAKMAAASQVHDEARHFYVMHDYLKAIGHTPGPMDPASRRVVEITLGTKSLVKKLLGMQLTIETIALTLFAQVRAMNVDPVLTELLVYYERDEARHVGLGIQLVPELLSKLSPLEQAGVLAFEVDLLGSSMMSLKAMEPDLASVGVSPRDILTLGFRKHREIYETIREEFTDAPGTPPGEHILNVLTELLFPIEGREVHVPARLRVRRAIGTLTGSHVPLGTSANTVSRHKPKPKRDGARRASPDAR